MTTVIIGAGPTGLAAAYALMEAGETDWILLEEEDHVGGLASSIYDDEGYTWDHGGHVVFSHYGEFDKILERLFSEEELNEHDRSSYVWSHKTWIPYPFQANIHMLPEPYRDRAIREALSAPGWNGIGSFEDYFIAEMGYAIADYFMRPYNKKVWATDPRLMGTQWLGERVMPFDKSDLRAKLKTNAPDIRWGPNNKFLFPKKGGTGEIWRRLCALLPRTQVKLSHSVTMIDEERQLIYARNWNSVAEGEQFLVVPYDNIISTMPLNRLLARLEWPEEPNLVSNCTAIVGIGVDGETGDDRSWLYFPESAQPFYRATNFSRYSENNAPANRGSWMCEIGMNNAAWLGADTHGQVQQTINGLEDAGLLNPRDVRHAHVHTVYKSYPIPLISRDEVLNRVQPKLEALNIYSRGRFGAWKYEYGNMDHSVVWGLDIVARLLNGTKERQKAYDSE